MNRVVIAGLAGLAALASAVGVRGAGHTNDSLESVKGRLAAKQAVLIDVREKPEWDRGHLQGAYLLPLSVLANWERDGIPETDRARIEKVIPRGTIVYCHCAAGARALSAGEILQALGYEARPLRQGYNALLQAGFRRAER